MKFASSYEPNEYEADIYGAWEAANIFAPTIPTVPEDDDGDGIDDREEQSDCYSIVMPPPNANGNLHIGHGLTIALEDSLTRYYRLRGKSAWYIPGADHAGFETWVVYEKTLEAEGHTRFEYDRNDLYAKVWDFVAEQRGNMELQLRALGASCSWNDLTFTLDENVIDRVYTTFEKMWNDGLIYRGEKLVNFCPKHQTAFADIEVDHQDEKGTLWDVEYKLVESASEDIISKHSAGASSHFDNGHEPESETANFGEGSTDRCKNDDCEPRTLRNGTSEASLIVSTTRPETLFGDVAVAVNPDDKRYKGLIGKHVKLPLTDRTIPIIADEHADPEYGTGAVKITPAHDFDDFEVGERHNLPRIQVISEDGTMVNVPEKYQGLTTKDCRKQVLHDLREQGLLKGEHKITHSVAHCYKCGTILEPTLKEQWFVDVATLAKTAIKHLNNDEIKFYPASKKQVLINYLENLKDWNISRQIPWGIAIPMFHQAGIEEPESQISQHLRGASSHFDNGRGRESCTEIQGRVRPSRCKNDDCEPSTLRNLTSGSSGMPDWIFDRRTDLKEIEVSGVKYIRDEDTFDTWFSSSHWPIVCTDWSEGKFNPYYPLNVMETGADILFAWVARMIMMGLYVTGEVPFKEVYLHGLVLDAHGKKMSKSKGNVINPMELVTKYGSDAFRIGILKGRSAGMNQAFSENSVIAGRNLCNKLWNISRLIQSIVDENSEKGDDSEVFEEYKRSSESESRNSTARGLSEVTTENEGFGPVTTGASDPSRESTILDSPYETLNMGEDWICREINDCLKQVEQSMATYRFAEAVEVLYQTIWDKYADWFLESQKIFKNTALLKQTLEHLLIALHPFAPFVTEAIWQNLSWTDGFIVTAKWPGELKYDAISAENFERLMLVVEEVRSTLQALPGTNNTKKYDLLYDNDSLVEDNLLLIKTLTKVPAVTALEGSPRGLKIALANHELYLDVPEKIVSEYRDALTDKILAVDRELSALEARMQNPNYVDKAPAHLVLETKEQIEEKQTLISRLKSQLNLI